MRYLEALAVLGLTPESTWDQVRAAYKVLARRCHPDHGGQRAAWDRTQAAYVRLREEFSKPQRCATCGGTGSLTRMVKSQYVNTPCPAGCVRGFHPSPVTGETS